MDEDLIRDLFTSEGPVSIRRMFGGHGIYLDGMIVAVDLRGDILLKADAETLPLFEAAGGRRWTYQREGRASVAMPYCFLPSEALDDPDLMAIWARRAREAALRAATKPKKRKARGRSRSA
ncbi:TfoX/Sxy family protein [Aureimonas leprariae]|uniref:TfoX/Sxy family protein n=1 Tax=Plantimonas leprariae TaxID=2615207 RepID=A0A7V7TXJ3_9HYPH|nr:TfoX/Sxy family protein [Aureimonas leprariae]KAB0681804.1 TfoX/Sxy family protein [Aureimonas leprariae]